MQQPNDFSIFLIIFNGLVTLVIALGIFIVKSIYKKIAVTDEQAKENREHSDGELMKMTKSVNDNYVELLEKQNLVKVDLIREQNVVKEHLVSQQIKVKDDLMAHYTIVERDLVKAINALNTTLEVHISKDA